MRISKQQAADNRSRIVEAAASLFRERGVGEVGIATVMGAAGLTHGGFYNHFELKDDLAAQAVAAAFDGAIARLEARASRARQEGVRLLPSYVENYLSRENRDAPGPQCPMAALGTEMARTEGDVGKAFAAGVGRYIGVLAAALPDSKSDPRATAITTLASLIGALTLARSVRGTELADEILITVAQDLADSG